MPLLFQAFGFSRLFNKFWCSIFGNITSRFLPLISIQNSAHQHQIVHDIFNKKISKFEKNQMIWDPLKIIEILSFTPSNTSSLYSISELTNFIQCRRILENTALQNYVLGVRGPLFVWPVICFSIFPILFATPLAVVRGGWWMWSIWHIQSSSSSYYKIAANLFLFI